MTYSKATAKKWYAVYRTHSLRATAALLGVSHTTVAKVLTHYGYPLRTSGPSPAVLARRQAARAAKLRARADAVEGGR